MNSSENFIDCDVSSRSTTSDAASTFTRSTSSSESITGSRVSSPIRTLMSASRCGANPGKVTVTV